MADEQHDRSGYSPDRATTGDEPGDGGPTSSKTASHGYHGDSDRYPFSEEEDVLSDEHSRKNIARRIVELTDDQEWDEFGLPKQRTDSSVDPVGGWMPDEIPGETEAGSDAGEPPRKQWQVNMRLDYHRYTALERAASIYGTRPTALARLLVNRGVEAILNAHRAEMKLLDSVDPEG